MCCHAALKSSLLEDLLSALLIGEAAYFVDMPLRRGQLHSHLLQLLQI